MGGGGFTYWWRYALRTPSRLLALALLLFGFVVWAVSPTYRTGSTEGLPGWIYAGLFLAGVGGFWIVVGWRHFWSGSRVRATRDRSMRLVRPSVPGWYEDPWRLADVRYWDGRAWTEQIARRARR